MALFLCKKYKLNIEEKEAIIIEKKYKSIFKGFLARNLLRMGNQIVDIKQDKRNTDKTIFIFEETDKFVEDLLTLTTSEKK